MNTIAELEREDRLRKNKVMEDRQNNDMTIDMLINLVETNNITDDNIHILVYKYYTYIYIDKNQEKTLLKINNWNVSKVTNMSYIFFDLSYFNQSLNKWNVSKVENMYHTKQYVFD